VAAKEIHNIGFIGLGVMGEPICRNLAAKCGKPVLAYDTRPEPLARLKAAGVKAAPTVEAIAKKAEVVFLSLPGGDEVRAVSGILLATARRGQIVIDLSTCPVDVARDLAGRFGRAGMDFADAPVARTRQAAADGTLSITVGASYELYDRIRPLLAHMASEITHCGDVGSGQIVKLMNNMVLMQTVIALAEALAIAGKAGMDRKVLLEALSKGSADSFAVRNHGMKAMLPRVFPTDAFSTRYALKDLSYALALAKSAGVDATAAKHAEALYARSAEAGNAELYYPAVLNLIDPPG
jgi:3-hydroxyisobutyrate dehydrogenase-like beta-hydroxyacid dehydrogenase